MILIENDLFDVSGRLREIDPGYFAVYNPATARFEVHHKGQGGNTLALAVPFGALDSRTVGLVRKTRRENSERLIAEMDKRNARREHDAERKAVERALL